MRGNRDKNSSCCPPRSAADQKPTTRYTAIADHVENVDRGPQFEGGANVSNAKRPLTRVASTALPSNAERHVADTRRSL